MVNNRDRKSFGLGQKNSKTLLRRLVQLMFFIRVQSFRGPVRGELPHVQIFMSDEPNQLT